MSAHYQWYRDARGEFRWTYIAANGEPVYASSEGYNNKADLLHSIDLARNSAGAPTVEALPDSAST